MTTTTWEKMNHQAMPRLCDECLAKTLGLLARGQRPAAIFCEHTGSLAHLRITPGGTITEWRVIGPNLTPARVEHLIALEDAARKGLRAALEDDKKFDD